LLPDVRSEVLPELRPELTQAQVALTREITVTDERGHSRELHIPAERPLTLYLDRRELVTLMTIGAHAELLALGYLRNQRLVKDLSDVRSVQVDWDAGDHVVPTGRRDDAAAPREADTHTDSGGACAVVTRSGVHDIEARTSKRIVTTGCGQGTVYGSLMDEVDQLVLPDSRLEQGELYAILETMREHDSLYKKAGSVHGCGLFRRGELLFFTEDVGRHNALDATAGWMWFHGVSSDDTMLYTTGRLTSEMVIKAAQMGVAIIASRSGATDMGLRVAEQLGMTLLARCLNRHFLLYSGAQRFVSQPELAVR
jgi:FdhD protein